MINNKLLKIICNIFLTQKKIQKYKLLEIFLKYGYHSFYLKDTLLTRFRVQQDTTMDTTDQ